MSMTIFFLSGMFRQQSVIYMSVHQINRPEARRNWCGRGSSFFADGAGVNSGVVQHHERGPGCAGMDGTRMATASCLDFHWEKLLPMDNIHIAVTA
jgi:hypothetical protein